MPEQPHSPASDGEGRTSPAYPLSPSTAAAVEERRKRKAADAAAADTAVGGGTTDAASFDGNSHGNSVVMPAVQPEVGGAAVANPAEGGSEHNPGETQTAPADVLSAAVEKSCGKEKQKKRMRKKIKGKEAREHESRKHSKLALAAEAKRAAAAAKTAQLGMERARLTVSALNSATTLAPPSSPPNLRSIYTTPFPLSHLSLRHLLLFHCNL